jgi:D-ribose pyranose/furanose isomerase RbsD
MKFFTKIFEILDDAGEIIGDYFREPLEWSSFAREKLKKDQEADIQIRVANETATVQAKLEESKKSLDFKFEELRKDTEFARKKELAETMLEFSKKLQELHDQSVVSLPALSEDIKQRAKKVDLQNIKDFMALVAEAKKDMRIEDRLIEEEIKDEYSRQALKDINNNTTNILIQCALSLLNEMIEDRKRFNIHVNSLISSKQSSINESIRIMGFSNIQTIESKVVEECVNEEKSEPKKEGFRDEKRAEAVD